MKIGLFGGTFDPPHNGHLALAKAALEGLELDEVLFMPAARNPLKRGYRLSAAKHRIEMVRLLIEKEPGMAVSDLETTRGGLSYTVDTLLELNMARPAEYWFLMGVDALGGLMEWKQPSRLVKLCRIGVVARGTRPTAETLSRLPVEFRDHIDIVDMKPLEVSATDLRDKLSRGQSIAPWTNQAVCRYIETNKLY